MEGPPADDYQSFGAYQRTLTLKCDAGEPGVITWKPDRNTPDTVYYHCFTHRYLGWKIHVHDSCDSEAGGLKGAASERHEIRLPAKATVAEPAPVQEDYAGEASVRHETKVSANDNFLLKHQTDLIKNHNMNGTPPKLSFEITKSSEITKLISDGIRAAEALEESLLRNPNLNPNHPNQNPIPNPHQKPNVTPTEISSRPEILLGETHAHTLNASPSASAYPSPSATLPSANLKLPILAAGPHLIHHPPHLHRLHHQPQHAPHPHVHLHHHNLTANLPALAQKTIGLSEFLRPPQNAPLFHPVKLPGRRPFPAPIKKVPASRPILPQQHPHLHPHPQQHPVLLQQQPSLIVSHYRKPIPGLLKPFVKEKPFPLQPLAASVLLLGQPTELGGLNNKGERLKIKGKPKIPVPYVDLEPQGSLQNTAIFNQPGGKGKGDQKPKASSVSISTTPIPLVKRPTVKEPSQEEIASMRPAVNQGFKPDTVIVESGFKPIVRTDGTGVQLPKEIIDQVAHRREDPGTEIDEVMETDTLFLAAQQGGSETQSFEPMFIPSPLDSTNATKVLRVNVKEVSPTASALRLPSAALEHALPSASELIKPTLDELFAEDLNEEELEMEPMPVADDVESLEETTKKDAVTTTINIPRNTTKKPDPDLLEDLFGPDEEELYADELELDMDDRVAAAAERIDTYYLPPDNRKIPDTRVPSGALYTFDGKSVVDSSLVLPPKLDAPDNANVHQRHAQYGLTPLEQLVRTTPQFGVYRGELPQEFRGTEPQPVSEYSHPAPFSRTTPVFSSSSGSTIYPYSSSTGASTSTVSSSASSPLSSSSLRPISTKLQLLKPEGRRA